MATSFQREFRVNDEFYTAEGIRRAIKKHFPLVDRRYTGLARIITPTQGTAQDNYHHADGSLDLKELIPEITSDTEIPSPLPRRWCYGVVEGEPKTGGIGSTFFIPTDLGYICDEMR